MPANLPPVTLAERAPADPRATPVTVPEPAPADPQATPATVPEPAPVKLLWEGRESLSNSQRRTGPYIEVSAEAGCPGRADVAGRANVRFGS